MTISRFLLVLLFGLGGLLALATAEEKAVPKPLALSVGKTIRLQLPSKKPIKLVTVDNDHVVRATPALDDRTAVLLTGVAPGRARVVIVGEDGKKVAWTFGGQ